LQGGKLSSLRCSEKHRLSLSDIPQTRYDYSSNTQKNDSGGRFAMKLLLTVSAATMLTAMMASGAVAQTMSKDDQIAQAVKAAPEALRAGATVVNYDAKGEPMVLRQGNNGIVCTPNQMGSTSFSVNCYGQALRAQHDFQAKEKADGKDAKAQAADLADAMKSGKLQAPPTGTAMYSLSGKTEASARGMWVVLVPNMTAEATGLPTQPTANGTPWLMRAGTPAAHIHIPQAAPAG
jgi:hypothetical protein